MIQVQIGTARFDLEDVSESWLNEQIHRRRADGVPVCIKVIIRTSTLDMILSTPDCPGAGGGRPPNAQEQAVLDLWKQMRLNADRFAGGNMIAFLKRVRDLL